jgi:nucleotide-binding universal stress UspA family protein
LTKGKITMFHKIMVAYDDSPEAGRALKVAIELARGVGAELGVATVLEPIPSYFSFAVSANLALDWTENKRARCIRLQAQARRRAAAAGLYLDTHLISGDEVAGILECARRYNSDLLVLGMRKHNWLRVGHTAKDIAERAPCALLGIR